MMKLRLGLCGVLLMAAAQATDLLTTGESATLLRKMGSAARSLNYSGVYLYQHGADMEAFRVLHLFDAGGEQERREALDGMAREFVRNNDQIYCYVPDHKPFALDRKIANKFFPGLIPDQASDVLASYSFKRGEMERVAGYDCQSILLDPRDKLRLPHRLCVEPSSGLMLKSVTFNPDDHDVVEQFAFTEIDIGGQIDKRQLKPTLASKTLPPDPAISNSHAPAVAPLPQTATAQPPATLPPPPFVAVNLPSGFRMVREMQTTMPGRAGPVQQYLYSDGLASVSVFLELASTNPVSLPLKQGRFSFYSRQVDGWRITAVGEVPARTVQLFVMGFEPR